MSITSAVRVHFRSSLYIAVPYVNLIMLKLSDQTLRRLRKEDADLFCLLYALFKCLKYNLSGDVTLFLALFPVLQKAVCHGFA